MDHNSYVHCLFKPFFKELLIQRDKKYDWVSNIFKITSKDVFHDFVTRDFRTLGINGVHLKIYFSNTNKQPSKLCLC